jgi:hypothetical protein
MSKILEDPALVSSMGRPPAGSIQGRATLCRQAKHERSSRHLQVCMVTRSMVCWLLHHAPIKHTGRARKQAYLQLPAGCAVSGHASVLRLQAVLLHAELHEPVLKPLGPRQDILRQPQPDKAVDAWYMGWPVANALCAQPDMHSLCGCPSCPWVHLTHEAGRHK